MVRGKESSLGWGIKDKVGEGRGCLGLEEGLREEMEKAVAADSEFMALVFPSPQSWSWLGRASRAGTWWNQPPVVRVIPGDATVLTVLWESEIARP